MDLMNYLKLFEDGSTEATAELPTWGEISATGDYYIDGLWYDKTGVLYVNQFTYLSNKGKLAGIEVANGVPVDIHYDELAPTLVEDTIKVNHLDGNEPNSRFVKNALNASGTAPIYACRAWVNFNGTGTVAIRASGNVSSITDIGTGYYTVNFITAMEDVNYSAVTTSGYEDATPRGFPKTKVLTVNGVTVTNSYYNNTTGNLVNRDNPEMTIIVSR
jgi:hypothetical protein